MISFPFLSRGVIPVAILLALCSCAERSPIDYKAVEALMKSQTLELWEKCEYDLLYLVGKKDGDAFIAAARILPTLIRSDQSTHLDWLLVSLFENAPSAPDLLRSLPDEDLIVLVHYCDIHPPLDWNETRRELVENGRIPDRKKE